jgi:FAD/FMN-containing dehydrogenase
VHDDRGIRAAQESFRALIDLAIRNKGSYYLTYHRWATKQQVEACYPQFREFLRLKKAQDPDEVFRSDWYVHHRKLLND